jgi:hypothetical protein
MPQIFVQKGGQWFAVAQGRHSADLESGPVEDEPGIRLFERFPDEFPER